MTTGSGTTETITNPRDEMNAIIKETKAALTRFDKMTPAVRLSVLANLATAYNAAK